MVDRASFLQRRIQRIDRGAGNTERAHDAFLFQDSHGSIDRPHLRHFETSLMLLDVMITATTDDLNGVEYVSRDVEWLVKSAPDQIVGCIAQ